jgi:hypothetical protein
MMISEIFCEEKDKNFSMCCDYYYVLQLLPRTLRNFESCETTKLGFQIIDWTDNFFPTDLSHSRLSTLQIDRLAIRN